MPGAGSEGLYNGLGGERLFFRDQDLVIGFGFFDFFGMGGGVLGVFVLGGGVYQPVNKG